MPEKKTTQRARRDRRQGKSASTQAGAFVREEIEHVREGKHGARSTKQAIAIGLSKARRAGVKLAAPAKGKTSGRTRRQAEHDLERGTAKRSGGAKKKTSASRSRGAKKALAKEGRSAASHASLARQGRAAARKRSAAERSASAKKAARTRRKASRRK